MTRDLYDAKNYYEGYYDRWLITIWNSMWGEIDYRVGYIGLLLNLGDLLLFARVGYMR